MRLDSDTKQTVCTANDNTVYVVTKSGNTTTPLHSSGLGMIGFSSGECTNCEVTMDSTNNKALIGLSLPGPGLGGYQGGFQYLDLDTLTFEKPFLSESHFQC